MALHHLLECHSRPALVAKRDLVRGLNFRIKAAVRSCAFRVVLVLYAELVGPDLARLASSTSAVLAEPAEPGGMPLSLWPAGAVTAVTQSRTPLIAPCPRPATTPNSSSAAARLRPSPRACAATYSAARARSLPSWEIRPHGKPFWSKLIVCVEGIHSRRQCRVDLRGEAEVEWLWQALRNSRRDALRAVTLVRFLARSASARLPRGRLQIYCRALYSCGHSTHVGPSMAFFVPEMICINAKVCTLWKITLRDDEEVARLVPLCLQSVVSWTPRYFTCLTLQHPRQVPSIRDPSH